MIASTPALIGTGNPEAGDYAGLIERLNMTEPNSPREAVEQHRESLYPTLPPGELVGARGFENLTRVVVAQHGVYGRAAESRWFQLKPIAEVNQASGINDLISQRRAQAEMKIAQAKAEGAPRFKVGDVVVLCSGGPKMTAWEIRPDGIVSTDWFAGGLLQRDAFAEAELELAPA